jgi:hypothetical protein
VGEDRARPDLDLVGDRPELLDPGGGHAREQRHARQQLALLFH